MSSNNNMQILDKNLATSLGTLVLGSRSVPAADRFITHKFDGTYRFYESFETDPSFRTVSLSSRTIATEANDGSYVTFPQYVMDFVTGTTGVDNRITNFLLRFDETTVDETYKILVEVYQTLPPSYDARTNRPLRVYWGHRVSPSYWYVYTPFFGQDLSYRIKVYAEEGGLSGDLLIDDMFIGTSIEINRPVGQGFTVQRIDRSQVFEAESGRRYYLQRNQFNSISSLTLSLLDRYTKEALYNWSARVGICRPFWIILDPNNNWDGPSFAYTFGAYRLVELPAFSHDFLQLFSTELILEEAI